MGERLSIEEIERRYDGGWVALTDVSMNGAEEVVAGRMLARSTDSDAVYDEVERTRPKTFTILCFQEIPAGWILAL